MNTISARDFNNDVGAAKRQAKIRPVIITDRGEPAYVLMSFAEFERLSGQPATLVETLRMDEDVPFDAPRIDLEPRAPEL